MTAGDDDGVRNLPPDETASQEGKEGYTEEQPPHVPTQEPNDPAETAGAPAH